LENVALPLMVAGNNRKESLEKAESLLSQLNLAQRLNHFPSQLSGGEQQRTALARALINNPSIILADEPTGNLDSAHSADVLELLQRINIDYGCTFLLVTHDLGIADKAQTHYKLENGTLYKLK